jgi:hypothetical protein
MKIKKSESGQALYILVFGIISLIGFTALAIDGGRLYSERRVVQGVADTASFTGAVYLARATLINTTVRDNAIIAANQIAKDNGYDGADADVSVTTTIDSSGYYYLVTTFISSGIDPTFAQLIYDGPMRVEAQSITRVLPLADMIFGSALTSLNKNKCDAMKFSGSSDTVITGSGIFSNSDCTDPNTGGVSFEGSGAADIDYCISTVGIVHGEEDPDVTYDCIEEGLPPFPQFSIDIPDCTGMPLVQKLTDPLDPNHFIFTPGYTSNRILLNDPNTTFTFNHGLYCIDNANGFKVNSGTVEGERVMFYVKGEIDTTGGDINLSAATDSSIVDSSGIVWNGMLFYVGGDYPVTLNGNAGSIYQGTIFAPQSDCKLNGSGSETGLDLNMVCDTIDLIGGNTLKINFSGTTQFQPPTNLSLLE